MPRKLIQDATGTCDRGLAAQLAQFLELTFKLSQYADTTSDMPNVLVKQVIDCTAVLGWSVLEFQQYPNLVERHVQATAIADEQQPFRVRVAVDAIVAFGACSFRQQALALVVADGFDMSAGIAGNLADFHDAYLNHSLGLGQHRTYAVTIAS